MNSQDMSIVTLVLHASWVVQFVMLLLLGIPGFIGTLLSGISTTGNFYFF